MDNQLLLAWTAVETIISNNSPGTATTYDGSIEYLVSHAEELEESIIDDSRRKAKNGQNQFYGFIYSRQYAL